MYAKRMANGILGNCLSTLHAKLAESVKAAVDGALSGGHLSLSQMARSVRSAVAVRHRVNASTDPRWPLLRASIAVEGRSVILYEEIHPQKKYGNQEVHRRFLACLEKRPPVGCRPIIITDAGFHSTGFDGVSAHPWP